MEAGGKGDVGGDWDWVEVVLDGMGMRVVIGLGQGYGRRMNGGLESNQLAI